MKTKTPRIKTLTRTQMVKRACPGHCRVGWQLAHIASETYSRYGYCHSLPAYGPAFEKVALVPLGHPLHSIVDQVHRQRERFSEKELLLSLGCPVQSREGLTALSRAGLAVKNFEDGVVELGAASPDAASIINRRRLGPSRCGMRLHKVIEIFAPGPPVKRAGEARVLNAGIAMATWGLDSPDLLDRPARVHLVSEWQFAT
jgi:hypothetical protein